MHNEPEAVKADSMHSTGGPNGQQVPAPFFDCFVLWVFVKDMFQEHERPRGKLSISVRTFDLMSGHPR